jgi:hypothetical protein
MLLRRTLLTRISATALAGALVSPGRAGADATAHQTVLIIRHAEKPDTQGDVGVDASGAANHSSLTPRGWQRAGVWAELFAPSLGQQSLLPTPQIVFASMPQSHAAVAAGEGGSPSSRPLETISPLASKLAIKVNLRFDEGSEAALAAAVAQTAGVTLVCWQHQDIPKITKALAPDVQNVPSKWPSDCFNAVFRFDRPDPASPWTFQQIVPVMLQGDKPGNI